MSTINVLTSGQLSVTGQTVMLFWSVIGMTTGSLTIDDSNKQNTHVYQELKMSHVVLLIVMICRLYFIHIQNIFPDILISLTNTIFGQKSYVHNNNMYILLLFYSS